MTDWSQSAIFAAAALVGARIAGLFLVAPFFRSSLFPWRLKLGVIGLLTVTALSSPAVSTSLFERASELQLRLAPSLGAWLLLAGEAIIGIVIAWSAFLVLGAVRGAASLISQQAGLSAAAIADPQGAAEESALPFFHAALTVFIFISLDLHLSMIRLVFESFTVAPPGSVTIDLMPGLCAQLVWRVGADLLSAALILAIPLCLTLALVSMAQGLLGRVLPEAELFTLGLPVRSCVAIVSLVAILPAMSEFLRLRLDGAIADGRMLLAGLGG